MDLKVTDSIFVTVPLPLPCPHGLWMPPWGAYPCLKATYPRHLAISWAYDKLEPQIFHENKHEISVIFHEPKILLSASKKTHFEVVLIILESVTPKLKTSSGNMFTGIDILQ